MAAARPALIRPASDQAGGAPEIQAPGLGGRVQD